MLPRLRRAGRSTQGEARMKKCKITVLKTTFDEELAREYGVPGLGPCPMMKAGQCFKADYAILR